MISSNTNMVRDSKSEDFRIKEVTCSLERSRNNKDFKEDRGSFEEMNQYFKDFYDFSDQTW